MNYKYTVIAKTITKQLCSIHHYESKADAIQEARYLMELGYWVEIVKYSIFISI